MRFFVTYTIRMLMIYLPYNECLRKGIFFQKHTNLIGLFRLDHYLAFMSKSGLYKAFCSVKSKKACQTGKP